VFTDSKATVGDVKTAGSDLAAPRGAVSSAAKDVNKARNEVSNAQADLVDAQGALADAQSTAAGGSTAPTTAPPATTTTTIVPPATVNRVKQAEAELTKASQGITDSTPLTQAAAQFNAAAFSLEIAWLKLLSDAGCITDEQQTEATARVAEYTAALQSDLQRAGYYRAAIDGIYGTHTVTAVEQLQKDNGLPVTGFVDQATSLALDKQLAAVGQQAAAGSLTHTSAVQTVLKLTGYWTGPIDGQWTQELTDALKSFQTALGVEPTGVVDTATMAAFQQALANLKSAATTPTTTTTTPPTATTTTATVTPTT
jgi:peptidoglycan hydrolase-like protein with peptidoglycan-binding domain